MPSLEVLTLASSGNVGLRVAQELCHVTGWAQMKSTWGCPFFECTLCFCGFTGKPRGRQPCWGGCPWASNCQNNLEEASRTSLFRQEAATSSRTNAGAIRTVHVFCLIGAVSIYIYIYVFVFILFYEHVTGHAGVSWWAKRCARWFLSSSEGQTLGRKIISLRLPWACPRIAQVWSHRRFFPYVFPCIPGLCE